jgi:hypothetical protein
MLSVGPSAPLSSLLPSLPCSMSQEADPGLYKMHPCIALQPGFKGRHPQDCPRRWREQAERSLPGSPPLFLFSSRDSLPLNHSPSWGWPPWPQPSLRTTHHPLCLQTRVDISFRLFYSRASYSLLIPWTHQYLFRRCSWMTSWSRSSAMTLTGT